MDNNKLYFVVETFVVDDGRKLKKYDIDEDGFYCGVPVAVIGDKSRNNTLYTKESFVECVSGDTAFRKVLEEGSLIGEWGHPIVDMSTDFGLYRLSTIDPTREAVSYRKIYVKHIDDLGLDIVFADMKPSGPFGKYFKERMDDPTLNCSSSLRSFSRQRIDPRTKTIIRDIVQMVTFDTGVAGGGFKYASKRYGDTKVASQEVYSYDLSHVTKDAEAVVALESIVGSELNDIFKSKEVRIGKQTIKVGINGTDSSGRSILNNILRRTR